MNSNELHAKYDSLLDGFTKNPKETYVYVPFQDTPNLPGFRINTLEIDGKTLYHGLSKEPGNKTQCIPTFTSLDEVQPSYGKYFELISLPISEVVSLITPDSTAQAIMVNMFSDNIFLGQDWVKIIREGSK